MDTQWITLTFVFGLYYSVVVAVAVSVVRLAKSWEHERSKTRPSWLR
jgi:hypothetical protein